MNRIRHIRRLTAALAGLACAWLGIAMIAPAAFAAVGRIHPPGGGSPGMAGLPEPLAAHIHQLVPQTPGPVPIHAVVGGGMPGWQITLIAVGAALLAATLAVLLDPDTSHPPERDHRRLSRARRTNGAAGPAMLARRHRSRPPTAQQQTLPSGDFLTATDTCGGLRTKAPLISPSER